MSNRTIYGQRVLIFHDTVLIGVTSEGPRLSFDLISPESGLIYVDQWLVLDNEIC